ncbi:MAG: hypothetical protein JO108_13260 [Acidobacteriaceae bacterium]|nr:hypothetical protein [Acidobacteriaceae bacterium]
MPGHTVYLEAADRTQALLDIKWTLKSAGFRIRSTWHEGQASLLTSKSKDQWNVRSVEQLQRCDSLVVICENNDRAAPEVAMMAGVALARGLEVIWIGPLVGPLSAFEAVRQFDTAEHYRTQILQQMYFRPLSTAERLAA